MKTRKKSLNSTQILLRLGAGEEIRAAASAVSLGVMWMQKPSKSERRPKDSPTVLFTSHMALKRKGITEELERLDLGHGAWIRRWGLKKA